MASNGQKKLKNMVFDMGGVLINYLPRHFIEREGITDKDEQELFLKLIFYSKVWPLIDLGVMTEEELEAIVRPQIPESRYAVAHKLIYDYFLPLEPIPGMADFIRECKEKGMGIYLVSNASLRQKTYWHDIPGSEYFDGEIVSAYERCVKPNAEIFNLLLSRYGLEAGECMFVDDLEPNVNGARAVGMRAFHFKGDVEALRRAVYEAEQE